MVSPKSVRWVRAAVRVSLLGLVGLLLVLPAASVARSTSGGPAPAVAHLATSVAASATWNGVNLSQASSVGSAFSVTTGETAVVNFTYPYSILTGSPISTGRMVVYYFGSEISANSVPAALGRSMMNWTLGSYTYLLQGTYKLTASLVDLNGTTAWSENFYIVAKAPYRVGSGVTVFLLVLGAVEIWSIATSARRVRPTKPGGPPTPWQSTPPEPAPATGAPAAPPPPTPAPDAPPPSGGSP